MKRRILLAVCVALALSMAGGTPARAEEQKPQAAVSSMTSDFIRDASAAGQFEIDSSKIALGKSKDAKVKDLAQTMINDHTKAGDELKATLSDDEKAFLSPAVNEDQAGILERLEKYDTISFDDNYLNEQVKAHKQAVKLFENYAAQGDSPAVKAFAAKTLPTLKHHQEMAEKLEAELK